MTFSPAVLSWFAEHVFQPSDKEGFLKVLREQPEVVKAFLMRNFYFMTLSAAADTNEVILTINLGNPTEEVDAIMKHLREKFLSGETAANPA